MAYILDDISDSYCKVEAIYDSEEPTHDLHSKETFSFDFEVVYTRIPEPDSDGEEDYMSDNVETRTTCQHLKYGRDLFISQDEEQIKGKVCEILYEIGVPAYRGIVKTFTEEIESIMKSPLEKLKKIKVKIDVVANMFPEDEMGVEESDVKYLVAGASVEAIEKHLETVTVIDESVGDCVICMETIEVGSGLVGRMPCKHVFHRVCIEKRLVETGVCPLCRDVFPV